VGGVVTPLYFVCGNHIKKGPTGHVTSFLLLVTGPLPEPGFLDGLLACFPSRCLRSVSSPPRTPPLPVPALALYDFSFLMSQGPCSVLFYHVPPR